MTPGVNSTNLRQDSRVLIDSDNRVSDELADSELDAVSGGTLIEFNPIIAIISILIA